jgi:hypothetical protein
MCTCFETHHFAELDLQFCISLKSQFSSIAKLVCFGVFVPAFHVLTAAGVADPAQSPEHLSQRCGCAADCELLLMVLPHDCLQVSHCTLLQHINFGTSSLASTASHRWQATASISTATGTL